MNLLREINRTQGSTFLIVTHDPAVARFTDRVVVMADGRIVRKDWIGSPLDEDRKMWRLFGAGSKDCGWQRGRPGDQRGAAAGAANFLQAWPKKIRTQKGGPHDGAGVVAGYLLGSISFARIITRLAAPGVDLTSLQVQLKDSPQTADVGIVGANAASMVLGPRLGLLVALLDMLKVVLPMIVAKLLYPAEAYHFAVSVGGLIGHNWPVYYGFKGGRGFAVIFGSFLMIDWVGAWFARWPGCCLA
jgi:hypothetical protein